VNITILNIKSCLLFSGAILLLLSSPAVAELKDLPSQKSDSDQTTPAGNEASSVSTAIPDSQAIISDSEHLPLDPILSDADLNTHSIPLPASGSRNSTPTSVSNQTEDTDETIHVSNPTPSPQEEENVEQLIQSSSPSQFSPEREDIDESPQISSPQILRNKISYAAPTDQPLLSEPTRTHREPETVLEARDNSTSDWMEQMIPEEWFALITGTDSSDHPHLPLSNPPSSPSSAPLLVSTHAEDLGEPIQISVSEQINQGMVNATPTSRVFQPRTSRRLSGVSEVTPEMVNATPTSRVFQPRTSRRLSGVSEVTPEMVNTNTPDQTEEMTTEDWLALIMSDTDSLEFASVHISDNRTLASDSTQEILGKSQIRDWETEILEGSMEQVTSVSQLSDVQPTDWSFQALQSLVERYGVIAGYPDGTFRGNRSLSRYEFAAALSSALDVIQQSIDDRLSEQPSLEDLETLRRLQADFAPELSTLRNRVDTLEARTAEIEGQQFSTTVRLNGQAIFGLATAGGGNPPGDGEANVIFTYLSQLQLTGSLSGRDLLRIGFTAGNFGDRGFANPEALNTNMALLSYQSDTDDRLELDTLEYRFAVGDRLVIVLQPVGFDLGSVLDNNSPYADSGEGAISRFAGENPIFKLGGLDAGVGFKYLLADWIQLQVAYGVRNSNSSDIGIRNSNVRDGFFSSDHRALGVQLFAQPTFNLSMGIAYVNAFAEDGRLDTYTGSFNADTSGNFNEPSTIHAVSGTLQWQVIPNITLGAWGGLTITDSLPSNALVLSTTFLFSLGFTDPFNREGDLLGILVGQPPRLQAGIYIERADKGAGLHYEVFYRYRISDNISITPGIFVVTDPGHIPDNRTIFVAALRTTFRF
jgi:hypothetical protein